MGERLRDLDRQIIVYLTALHEIGHALGMEHTADISTIMYLFREPGDGDRFFGTYRRKLRSADDVLPLRKLYDDATATRTR